jgi:multisubunit Na+/H+ antiporter MnhF subunit
MLTTILDFTFKASLLVHVVLIAIAVWRIWKGKDVIDRLISVDLVGTLFLAVLVLLALIFSEALYIDVALALAALGFVSLVALAKYVADEQMF